MRALWQKVVFQSLSEVVTKVYKRTLMSYSRRRLRCQRFVAGGVIRMSKCSKPGTKDRTSRGYMGVQRANTHEMFIIERYVSHLIGTLRRRKMARETMRIGWRTAESACGSGVRPRV